MRTASSIASVGAIFGECRKIPPIIIQIDYETRSLFPLVEKIDWCGEFLANKVT